MHHHLTSNRVGERSPRNGSELLLSELLILGAFLHLEELCRGQVGGINLDRGSEEQGW